jgi:hypothetical protein
MYKKNILIFFHLFIFLSSKQIKSDDIEYNYYEPYFIYGEENSPENIYYKYILNNPNALFFYSIIGCKNIHDQDVIALIIIPNQSSESIFLLYNMNLNYLRQYSLIYDSNVTLSNGIFPFFITKYEYYMAEAELIYDFLLRQYDFLYCLTKKEDLIMLVNSTFPSNVKVQIDNFSICAPLFIKNKK